MKSILYPVTAFIASFFCLHFAAAQLPYSQSFKSTTATGVTMSGNSKLTAASGIDADGQGYLRLTDNITNQVGYVYAKDPFPSGFGLTTTFEFFTYKTGATAYNQADGISFFLFDAATTSFRPGGLGGSLGYAQYYSTLGMSNGYMGIGIDEFGNYSNSSEGRSGQAAGLGTTSTKVAGAIVVRGPGNGKSATDYKYVTGVQTTLSTYNASFLTFTQRYPDSTTASYRKIKIVLTPGSSLGADKGYTISVSLYKGGMPVTEVPLITNYDYPYIAPSKLQYGFAASTGSATDYHEIRNINISATNATALVAPTLTNDAVSMCQGQSVILDVTANDISNNSGGSINAASVDLDPATTGTQTTFTDAGKGTYSVDQSGIVTFTPVTGFTGSSVINYKVNDTYGATPNSSATITVTVGNGTAPSLTVTDPSGVCAPQTVDITNSSLRSNTTTGAAYDYFSTLTNANNNTNNINATASALSTAGTYYIRASTTGCATVKPVVVQVSQAPTTAAAGNTQYLCGTTSTTMTGNNPTTGTGTWTQISGPSTATISLPNYATTSIYSLQKGPYVFRWSIANGSCTTSISDMQILVTNTASAGTNQTLSSTTTMATLTGNDPLPGTGRWTQTSGSTAVIVTPTTAQSTVTGLASGNTYVFNWAITNGTCNTSSSVTINVTALLPLNLLSFTGVQDKNNILLSWQTAAGNKSNYFILERSTNAADFLKIATIAATSSNVNGYTYTDSRKEITGAVVYYRLQQVDPNGKISYSNIVKVDLLLTSKSGNEVWPNPFKDHLEVTVYCNNAGTAAVNLYDPIGRLIQKYQQQVVQGYNHLLISHLEKTSHGLYIVEVNKEGTMFRQKVIKE